MLSCDRIESAKFIHGTLSVAKLVYYIIVDNILDINFITFNIST